MAQNNIKYSPTVNNFNTTLNGAIGSTTTTINLNSVTGLQNLAGILVIDRVDSSGNLTPSKQEWIYFTGVSGSSVTLPDVANGRGVAGSTAQSHSDGAIVEAVMDVSHWGGLVTSYVSQHADAGTHTAITGNTVGLASNASISGNVFVNTLNTASTASITGNLNAKNIIATNLSILSLASIADNTITANSLATGVITLGYTPITSTVTTSSSIPVQLTGLTQAVTIPSGGRKVKITAFINNIKADATTSMIVDLWDGVVSSGTLINRGQVAERNSGDAWSLTVMGIVSPSAGSKTYNVGFSSSASTVLSVVPTSTTPSFILVELI